MCVLSMYDVSYVDVMSSFSSLRSDALWDPQHVENRPRTTCFRHYVSCHQDDSSPLTQLAWVWAFDCCL